MRIHLLAHTDKREAVQCPFKACSKTYRFRGSLCSHFSRFHKNASVVDVKGCIQEPDQSCDIVSVIDNVSMPNASDNLPQMPVQPDSLSIPPVVTFAHGVADYYNILMHEKKIPYATLDYIVKKMISFEVNL
jgi:hypothetical protein